MPMKGDRNSSQILHFGISACVISKAFLKIMDKGPSIKYVCTEGGEGVQKLANFADKQSYGGADKGGRGSKIPNILRTYLMDGPL